MRRSCNRKLKSFIVSSLLILIAGLITYMLLKVLWFVYLPM